MVFIWPFLTWARINWRKNSSLKWVSEIFKWVLELCGWNWTENGNDHRNKVLIDFYIFYSINFKIDVHSLPIPVVKLKRIKCETILLKVIETRTSYLRTKQILTKSVNNVFSCFLPQYVFGDLIKTYCGFIFSSFYPWNLIRKYELKYQPVAASNLTRIFIWMIICGAWS